MPVKTVFGDKITLLEELIEMANKKGMRSIVTQNVFAGQKIDVRKNGYTITQYVKRPGSFIGVVAMVKGDNGDVVVSYTTVYDVYAKRAHPIKDEKLLIAITNNHAKRNALIQFIKPHVFSRGGKQ